jgi:hypothetical protein
MSLNPERLKATAARAKRKAEAKKLAAGELRALWSRVQEYAEAGATEQDIIAGLGISEEALRKPEIAQRLHDIVAKGNALARLELQTAIHSRGKKSPKGAGSVNALALRARNLLDWDRQTAMQEPPPDLTAAHARLRLTLERLAKAASEERGRDVTPAEILIAEVYHKEGEAVH